MTLLGFSALSTAAAITLNRSTVTAALQKQFAAFIDNCIQ
jgi:hypothetical protein